MKNLLNIVLVMLITAFSVSCAPKRTECNGFASLTKDTKPLTYRAKKKRAKDVSSRGLLPTDVAYKYRIHKYDRKTSDKKGQRLLKKESKKGKEGY